MLAKDMGGFGRSAVDVAGASELRELLQEVRPSWCPRDLAAAQAKLADVGVTRVEALRCELHDFAALNRRLDEAGLKQFSLETLRLLHDAVQLRVMPAFTAVAAEIGAGPASAATAARAASAACAIASEYDGLADDFEAECGVLPLEALLAQLDQEELAEEQRAAEACGIGSSKLDPSGGGPEIFKTTIRNSSRTKQSIQIAVRAEQLI